MSLLANVNRDSKRRPKPFFYTDFMPKFGAEPKKRQTWQEQKAIMESLMKAQRK